MLRRILVLIFLLILGGSAFGANVNVKSDVYLKETIFMYTINFGEGESYSSFSFEKPKNSIISSAYNKNNQSLFYSVAGDYFIFKPKDTSNQTFFIKFKSKQVSSQIINKNVYSVYVNFNVPIEDFKFTLNLADEVGEVKDIFPRDYTINSNGEFNWELKNLEKDTLFLINFENFINLNNDDNKNENNFILNWYNDKYFILITSLSVIVLILLIIFGRKVLFILSSKKNVEKKEDKINNIRVGVEKEEKKVNVETSKTKVDNNLMVDKNNEELLNESYDEFIKKYLTDNEKNVVEIVREYEGLSQYDILNYLPSLSKSNLSKIISKLNSRKILNRIKVGKVNKIYFGEKLDCYKVEKKENNDNS